MLKKVEFKRGKSDLCRTFLEFLMSIKWMTFTHAHRMTANSTRQNKSHRIFNFCKKKHWFCCQWSERFYHTCKLHHEDSTRNRNFATLWTMNTHAMRKLINSLSICLFGCTCFATFSFLLTFAWFMHKHIHCVYCSIYFLVAAQCAHTCC